MRIINLGNVRTLIIDTPIGEPYEIHDDPNRITMPSFQHFIDPDISSTVEILKMDAVILDQDFNLSMFPNLKSVEAIAFHLHGMSNQFIYDKVTYIYLTRGHLEIYPGHPNHAVPFSNFSNIISAFAPYSNKLTIRFVPIDITQPLDTFEYVTELTIELCENKDNEIMTHNNIGNFKFTNLKSFIWGYAGSAEGSWYYVIENHADWSWLQKNNKLERLVINHTYLKDFDKDKFPNLKVGILLKEGIDFSIM